MLTTQSVKGLHVFKHVCPSTDQINLKQHIKKWAALLKAAHFLYQIYITFLVVFWWYLS
jgi:hypothetical protein